ncbi:hypothetical protein EPA93_37660 [Ktedonosporobacter rubrisoli]|uniref:ATP-grasp domain-containing protein n=1 Tax=Ktedonosporobacter rubrisoli TaxID=2509675 RepID=A0A4P6K1P4_KTERU|nr:hypothetical protein [Ktedonosporobacter rubrisoli]QBD81396.1 hypothetical protein EPA93_37660 [Ktedonosporobacter rubrisoli]
MNICFIVDEESRIKTPTMKDVLRQLSANHQITTISVSTVADAHAIMHTREALADVYLLKSHTPGALEIARLAEEKGIRVINSWKATQACQDRAFLSELFLAEDVPWPRTWVLDRFEQDLSEDMLSALTFPLMVKARYAYEGVFVDKVDTLEQLKRLATYKSLEPVIIQEYRQSDGWDTKVWVIGETILAAKRRSPLTHEPQDQFQLSPQDISAEMRDVALRIGKLLSADVFVVDMLITEQGPVAIDVNPFPGFRGLFGPEKAFVSLIEGLQQEAAIA